MSFTRGYPTSVLWSAHADHTTALTVAGCGFFAAAAALALFAPPQFWQLLAGTAALAVVFLVFRHTVACSVIWLLVAGATLEMTLIDLVGPTAFQTTIAVVKAAELGLAVVCVLRYGPALDVFNPALGFLAMFLAGLAHGLYPSLSTLDSLRSLAGSVAPFAFAFSRLSRRWSQNIINAICWVPIVSVVGGGALDLAGLRPIFFESGGERLAGLGHPAFLGGLCLTAIYACLIELYRDGKSRSLILLAVNALLLVLTGARAPLGYAVIVTGLTLAFLRSAALPPRCRILPLLLAAALLPLMIILASQLSSIRLFNVLSNEAGNLSGRNLLWPPFREAAAASPWFGWGVGAGNAIIPPSSELARMTQTWAAHNEYLRMAVEGGELGRLLLIGLFVLWAVRHITVLRRTDRIIMRLVFIAFAAHAYTDNVLISTTACVFFAFVTAVFARGVLEREAGVTGGAK